MSLQGFDILNEKKKKKKTFMDYEPGHVGNDNYVITKPTITPKTTTAGKTGTSKNETMRNPPKSKLISRSDDDLLKNWDHRAFLEGFYEVDGATDDWEREKRMSLVDEALKDIEERNRKTNKASGFSNYANVSNTVTTRSSTHKEFEAVYADMQKEFSEKNTGKHLNGAAEYVINAATPQSSAKEAAERRRERYIREKAAQIPESKPGDMLRRYSGNIPERGQNTFTVNPRYANTLYPETQSGFYNGIAQKRYYTGEKSIYGENTDEALDAISNVLTAASLIPGIDTFADAAAIPVDLLRGDYISAGLDAFGILPFVGEVADTAKLARAGMNVADVAHDAGKVIDAVKTVDSADDVVDAVKAADDVFDYSRFPQKIHEGRQGKHIIGHNNYIPGKSITTVSNDRLLELMKTKVGTGTPYAGREVIDFGEVIGKYVDKRTGKMYYTTVATVHYSQDGFHIIPAAPKEWRR